MPFPSVILANHVFVRPLISQDLCTFISTFRSKYLRRRIGFPVSDKNTPELLNEFFLTVLSSYKSISLTFLFMIAEIETFEPVGILSFHPWVLFSRRCRSPIVTHLKKLLIAPSFLSHRTRLYPRALLGQEPHSLARTLLQH